MRVRLAVAVFGVLSLAGVVFGGPNNFAAGVGGTSPVNLNVVTQSGAHGNPALLGFDRAPRVGLNAIPVLPISVGLWSDEIAAFNLYAIDAAMKPNKTENWVKYLTSVFQESFALNVGGDSPEEVSRKISKGMKDGVGMYVGVQTSVLPLDFSMKGFSFGTRSYLDLELRLPGGILLPFFSYEDGLLRGNTLDFSSLSAGGIAATEMTAKFGWPLPALPQFLDYLNLDKGAYGVGVKHIFGHGMFQINADKGSNLKYVDSTNAYRMSAKVEAVAAGTGLKKDWDGFNSRYFDSTFLRQPAAGEGWGFDIGAVFHNDKHFVSVDMQDIGMIVWDGKKTSKATLYLDMDMADMDVDAQLNNFMEEIFDLDAVMEDLDDKYYVSYLPMSFNLDYTYYHNLADRAYMRFLVRYLTANAGLKQQIIRGPGKNYTAPALSFGGSAGLINGFLPLRYGITVGGPGKVSSVASIGVNARVLSFDAYARAVGSPFLIPKKGVEAAAALTFNWGYDKKKKIDNSIILDMYERARRLHARQRYWEAFFAFSRIAAEYPDFFKNDWVMLLRADCQERLDMREQGVINYNKVKEAYPAGEVAPHADLGLMRIYYRDGDFTQAANQFAELNRPSVPDSLKFHGAYVMGQIFMRNGEMKKAVQAFSVIPKTHPDYIFAQHATAVAHASLDSGTKDIVAALENAVSVPPKTKEEQETVNRSYLFMGLVFYEENVLSKAVVALRQVQPNSHYYEDALLGLGWTALKARQGNDCIAIGQLLAVTTQKPVLRAEGMLIQGYGHLLEKNYPQALEAIKAGYDISQTLATPDADSLAARDKADDSRRLEYARMSSRIDELSQKKGQTTQASIVLDSLKNRGAEYVKEFKDYESYKYEYRRGAFFSKSNEQVKSDLEYALLIVGATGGGTRQPQKAVEPPDDIDAEIEELKRQMEEMEGGR